MPNLSNPDTLWQLLATVTVTLSFLAIGISVLINFLESQKAAQVKSEKKSIVETGTMVGFFVIYYFIIRFHTGEATLNSQVLHFSLLTTGIILILTGTIVNILGRLKLGHNWANQVVIYKNHTLVTSGVFSLVRHPLYASLIWIFTGGGLVFLNPLALLINWLIFVPFMYYRAKQEEAVLLTEFKDYTEYQDKVGMFFPKL